MPARSLCRSASCALVLLLLPSIAIAWSNSPNLNTPVNTAAGDQGTPRLLSDGVGGVFVDWSSFDGGVYHGFVQRLDPRGNPLWGANGVAVSAAAGQQLCSIMVPDATNGMIVCWFDTRSGDLDIYVQRYNSAGVAQWAANGVLLAGGSGNQSTLDAISDGAGGMIVSWTDDRTDLADIYARRVNASGVPQWTANGVPICVTTGAQYYPEMAADGAGGAIITWGDERSGNEDVYAQRINAAGAVQWAGNGVPVCAVTNNQVGPVAVTDGAGGAYITWYDYRAGVNPNVYGQHLTPSGASQWLANGKQLTFGSQEMGPLPLADGNGGLIVIWQDYNTADPTNIYGAKVNAAGTILWGPTLVAGGPGNQTANFWLSDGLGGIVVFFTDNRDGNTDVYAQRIDANGAAKWTFNGAALSVAAQTQTTVRVAADGVGGFVAAFEDSRNGSVDIYGQRIHLFGQLGNPEPKIVSVKDVANDEGGQVRVSWNASYLDVGGQGSVCNQYRVWRQVPISQAQARMRRGESFRVTGSSSVQVYWELVGSLLSTGYPGYSMVVPTTGDSIGGSNPRTLVMVEGYQTQTDQHWDSLPDSGYSVDNLGPPVPAPFTGTYASGSAYLSWGADPATDLANYRLYRGVTAGFAPSVANRVASPVQTSFTDPAGAPYWYKLSAVDVHGNESGVATLLPSGTTDVAGAPRVLRIDPPSPNPSRGAIAFQLGLPEASAVRVELYDQQGRRVGGIAEQVLAAGERELVWGARNAAGAPIASGLYFYQVWVGDRTLRGRIALVR